MNIYREPSGLGPDEPVERKIILDISEYQGKVDFDLLATDTRIIGVIIRATYGNKGVDKQFFRNYREAKRVGLLRGVYHFADPDRRTDDARAEALHFIATVWAAETNNQLALTEHSQLFRMLYVLDIEKAGETSAGDEFTQWVLDFCEHVDTLLSCKYVCGIYTGGPFWNERDGDPPDDVIDRLTHRWLWIAAYVDDPSKYVNMTPWKHKGPAIHQWSGDVGPRGAPGLRYRGIPGNVCDTNYFLLDDFNLWIESLWLDDKPIAYPTTEVPQAVDIVSGLADTEPPDGEPNT